MRGIGFGYTRGKHYCSSLLFLAMMNSSTSISYLLLLCLALFGMKAQHEIYSGLYCGPFKNKLGESVKLAALNSMHFLCFLSGFACLRF